MIPADQPSSPDKKDLYYRVLTFRGRRQDIPVLTSGIRDLLLLGNLLHTVQKLPVFDGLLKFHGFRRFVHLRLQFRKDSFIMSVQKPDHLGYGFGVLFLRNRSLTGRIALMDMVVQAGSLLSDIPGQVPIAAPQMVQLVEQFDRIPHRLAAGIRSEIFCLVLHHIPCQHHPGKRLPHRHLDKRIRLVVHQHGIVLRPVLFDQIAFQHQRLQLGIRHDILKPTDVGHHLLDLDALVPAGLKILPHPVLQADRLSYIYNVVLLVMHQVYARPGRQLL